MATRKPPSGKTAAGRKNARKRAQSTRSARGDASPQAFIKKGNSRYDRHDVFYRRAKAEGFLARSVFKLEELDEAFDLIRPGDDVLDLGCAPGSWMQYAERAITDKGGRLVGIDLLPCTLSFGDNVKILQDDIFTVTARDLWPPGEIAPEINEDIAILATAQTRTFDVVLSDMAPNTTGIKSVDQARSAVLCERALEFAVRMLRPDGRFCTKMFEGTETTGYLKALRSIFDTVKIRRPAGVRVGSKETYLVALGMNPVKARDWLVEVYRDGADLNRESETR